MIVAPPLVSVDGVTLMAAPTEPVVPEEPAKLIDGAEAAAATVNVTELVAGPTEFVAVIV